MVSIREARPEDAQSVRDVHAASIRALGRFHYDEQQIDSWSDLDDVEYPITEEDTYVVVAEEDGIIVGFGEMDLDGGQLRAIYVSPAESRRGVGTALLRELEAVAQANGLDELHLSASLNAVPFYEHHGYRPGEDTTHESSGRVELEVIRMEKPLR